MSDIDQFPTYWVTRNEDKDGKLSDVIEVWLDRPTRTNLEGGGCEWSGDFYAEWTVAATLINCRTYPETSRECLVVG